MIFGVHNSDCTLLDPRGQKAGRMNHLFNPIVESMTSSQGAVSRNLSSDLAGGLEYHELGIRHPNETNVLEELKQNLDQLEDLHFRLKYLMGEITQHTRRKS